MCVCVCVKKIDELFVALVDSLIEMRGVASYNYRLYYLL